MKTYETNFQLDFPTSIYIIHKKKKLIYFKTPFLLKLMVLNLTFRWELSNCKTSMILKLLLRKVVTFCIQFIKFFFIFKTIIIIVLKLFTLYIYIIWIKKKNPNNLLTISTYYDFWYYFIIKNWKEIRFSWVKILPTSNLEHNISFYNNTSYISLLFILSSLIVYNKNAAYYLTIVTNIIHAAVHEDSCMYIEYNEVCKGVFERGCGGGGDDGRHTLWPRDDNQSEIFKLWSKCRGGGRVAHLSPRSKYYYTCFTLQMWL